MESVGWFLSGKPQAECPICFRQFLWMFTPVRRTLLEHEGLSMTSVLFAIDASYEGLECTLLFLVNNRREVASEHVRTHRFEGDSRGQDIIEIGESSRVSVRQVLFKNERQVAKILGPAFRAIQVRNNLEQRDDLDRSYVDRLPCS